MRKPSPSAESHLFTVRVWYEDLGESSSEWRGEVKEVASGQQRYFRDWNALLGFFQMACKAFETDVVAKKID